jgi:hypothetical protein
MGREVQTQGDLGAGGGGAGARGRGGRQGDGEGTGEGSWREMKEIWREFEGVKELALMLNMSDRFGLNGHEQMTPSLRELLG